MAGISGGFVVLHFYPFGMDAGKPSSLEVVIRPMTSDQRK